MRVQIESEKLENEEAKCYLDSTNRPATTMTESGAATLVSRWRVFESLDRC